MHPTGTVVIDKCAAQTPFTADGAGSFHVHLTLDAAAASVASPFALVFVIKRGANEWLKDGRSDFFVRLLRPPPSALEVRRKRASNPSDRYGREQHGCDTCGSFADACVQTDSSEAALPGVVTGMAGEADCCCAC
jgi:hypothetical protein